MFANTKVLVVIASCALLAQAQSSATSPASPSSTPAGLDQCFINCVNAAATSNGCSDYTDVNCLCKSTQAQQAALACLQANCSSADLATAAQLQQQECAALTSGSASGSGAASTAGSTGTSTSASATHSATSSSAAMSLSVPFSFGSLVATLFASAGALVGAAFVM